MAVLEKIQSLLEAAFPPPDKVRLEEDDRIIGTITSRRFDGMETIDRINLVWDILDNGLTAEERRHVLMIVPATPEDEIAYTAWLFRPYAESIPRALIEKVEAVLREVFPPPDKINLEDDDGIIGWVASERFAEMETIDRIHLIWDALGKGLTPEERRRVVMIIAVTPLEEIAHSS